MMIIPTDLKRTDHEEGMVRPLKGKKDPDVGMNAVLVLVQSDLDELLGLTRDRRRTTFDMGTFRLHCIESAWGHSFSVIGPFLGAPHAVMGLEKIIALGAKRIWALGWCGSLQSDLRIGDLIIPQHAVCEEGTSQHYPIQGQASSDEGLCAILGERLHLKSKPFKKGTVWTTDAPYRETPSKVISYRERGVLAVDMEMSALMTVSVYRSACLAGLLVVSDELFDLKWRPGFKDPLFKEACSTATRVMLEVADSRCGTC